MRVRRAHLRAGERTPPPVREAALHVQSMRDESVVDAPLTTPQHPLMGPDDRTGDDG